MLNLSLKTVVIYCDGLLFFLSLIPVPRGSAFETLISSDISVCWLALHAFPNTYLSINGFDWCKLPAKNGWKNWKKYGGIKRAPMTNKGNSIKTSNSLLLNMDFLQVCQWNKCTCLQFFLTTSGKLVRNGFNWIFYSRKVSTKVFSLQTWRRFPLPLVYSAPCVWVRCSWMFVYFWFMREWDAFHLLIFGAYLYVHTLTPFSSFGWLNTWVVSTWNANSCYGWMKCKQWKMMGISKSDGVRCMTNWK